MNNDPLSCKLVPVPVVLELTDEQATLLDAICARHSISASAVASIFVRYGQQAIAQQGELESNVDLPTALARFQSVHDGLVHRVGVAVSEGERLLLLIEALTVEARDQLSQFTAT